MHAQEFAYYLMISWPVIARLPLTTWKVTNVLEQFKKVVKNSCHDKSKTKDLQNLQHRPLETCKL